jgi:hypothetical protein
LQVPSFRLPSERSSDDRDLNDTLGISVEQYLAIQPAVRDDSLIVDGAALSVIPENTPKLLAAVGRLLHESRRNHRRDPAPETLRARVVALTNRGRAIANQLVALHNSARSERARELILEAATELRLILMRPGIE